MTGVPVKCPHMSDCHILRSEFFYTFGDAENFCDLAIHLLKIPNFKSAKICFSASLTKNLAA